jgi:FkbM family methyltransferase
MASSQGWNPAFTGRYDDEEIALLTDLIAPDSMVLDVGACFGLYTVPLAHSARQRGAHVVAFEPVARNYRVLAANLRINQLSDVAASHQIGLGRDRAVVTARVERGGAGNAVVARASEPDLASFGTSSERIELVSLDGFEDLPSLPCSLVKVDVEGFELDVLAGGRRFFARYRPTILGEFGDEFLRARGIDERAPLDWAAANEYSCYELVYSHPRWYSDRRRIALRRLDGDMRRSGTSLLLQPTERLAQLAGLPRVRT